MKRKFLFYIASLLMGSILWLGFAPDCNMTPIPAPAPGAMTIQLYNIDYLDFYDCEEYNDHEYKVTFTGSRYSDGQVVSDPSSPFYGDPWYFSEPIVCYCSNFYYCSGYANIWTREDGSSNWIFQGSMSMSTANCTLEGSKVTFFYVNCALLAQP